MLVHTYAYICAHTHTKNGKGSEKKESYGHVSVQETLSSLPPALAMCVVASFKLQALLLKCEAVGWGCDSVGGVHIWHVLGPRSVSYISEVWSYL